MEGAMIANPGHEFYRYNPYTKVLTKEVYEYHKMVKIRAEEIAKNKLYIKN